ncbi:MAG: hypothetical protein KAU17_02115 [Spirochaetales bacterium]|nr:hypothetical protein [Spirochaetales bacterium]
MGKKGISILVFILSINVIAFAVPQEKIMFPNDLFVIDSENNFNILIGSHADLFFKAYGKDGRSNVLATFHSPSYQMIEIVYSNDFRIIYSTYINRIDVVEISSKRFTIGNDLTIGSSSRDIVEEYGEPWTIQTSSQNDGCIDIIYMGHFPEINFPGEDTFLIFTLKDDMVVEISLSISSNV